MDGWWWAAGIETARYLVISLPHLSNCVAVIAAARAVNPRLKIFSRPRYLADRAAPHGIEATAVCFEQAEAAVALAELLLYEVGAETARIDLEANKIRDEFAIGNPDE